MNPKQAFQEAFNEINTTTNPRRFDYLKWIGYQMWKLFDYESGLEMIQSEKAYRKHRPVNLDDARQSIEERDNTGEPVWFAVKRGLFEYDEERLDELLNKSDT